MWINKDELPVSDSLFIQHGWWWSLLLQWVFRKQNSVGFPDGVCGKAQGWAPGGTAPFSPFSHAALHEGCSRGRECLRAALSCGLWALHQAILQTRDGPSFPLPAKLSLSSWRVSAQPRWRGGEVVVQWAPPVLTTVSWTTLRHPPGDKHHAVTPSGWPISGAHGKPSCLPIPWGCPLTQFSQTLLCPRQTTLTSN